MSSDELLPCPFCGKKAEVIHIGGSFGTPEFEGFDVSCGTDDCFLGYGADWHLSSEDIAIAMWNRRAT